MFIFMLDAFSSGHEVRSINDLFRPHDCIHLKVKVVPLLALAPLHRDVGDIGSIGHS
jgi:hypothetical protein